MKMNKKGFTLIELLIVVAIIAILAAIAIPQFSSYRIRGYNAAANSDIRNLKLAQESFKTDWQVYPSTMGCAPNYPYGGCTGGLGNGVVVNGPGNVSMSVIQYGIVAGQYPTAATKHAFGLSNGVRSQIGNTAVTAANYIAHTAHSQGDTIYSADSDNTQIKMGGKTAGGALTSLSTKVAGGNLALSPIASTAGDNLTDPNYANM